MKALLVFLFSILLLPGCEKNHQAPGNGKSTNTNNTDNTQTTGPVIQLSSFPLKVGNVWAYENEDTIMVVSDTIINGIQAIKVLKTNHGHAEVSYYANQPDGLYQLGTTADYHDFENALGMTIPNATVKFFTTPILIAKFPVDTTTRWNSYDPSYKNDSGQWSEYVTITNKAGKFDCIALTRNRVTEYYSVKGLVRITEQVDCIMAPCPGITTNLVYVNF